MARRQRKRGDAVVLLTGDLKCLPAGRKNRELWASLKQGSYQTSAGFDQMLAIVQNKQQFSVMKCAAERLGGITRQISDADSSRDNLRHKRWAGDAGKLSKPDAVGVALQ